MPVPGDRLADRYRIDAQIGAGGMATVHRAHDERLDRDVAIKVLLPNLAGDPIVAQRFEREARAMAMVADPGLVAVYDVEPGVVAAGREPFVVMELCPGGSLADRLGVGHPMAPDDLVSILVAVASALEALHRAGLVHRDVKPSNILFAADRVKLGDFGLVRSEAAGTTALTDPGTAMGTLAYLAPERLRGEPGGPPADVYALGTIAFLGLTGAMPRPTSSLRDLVAAAPFRPPAVSTVAPAIGSAFDETVLRALAVDPGRRPAALDFGIELTSALGRWRRGGGATAVVASVAPTVAAGGTDTSTINAFPVPPTAAFRVPPAAIPDPEPRPRAAGSRASIGILAAVALVAVLLAAMLVVPGLLGSLAPSASPAAVSLASPSVAASVPPSPSPSPSPSPAASPTPAPTPTPDPALARLDDVDAAIAAARGGHDGLKGKDANDLTALADRVRQDLAAGRRDTALRDALTLDRRARDVARHLEGDRGDALTSATGALVDALGG
jgi:protein kinase-like protein